jgi:hypothetical protein
VEGLNPFKIQSNFKSQKLVEFIFRILSRIGSLTNGESCFSSSYLSDLNFTKNLERKEVPVSIFSFRHLNPFGISR